MVRIKSTIALAVTIFGTAVTPRPNENGGKRGKRGVLVKAGLALVTFAFIASAVKSDAVVQTLEDKAFHDQSKPVKRICQTQVHAFNYGDCDNTCLRWSDGCRTCIRLADGSPSCSNIGIACQPKQLLTCLARKAADNPQ